MTQLAVHDTDPSKFAVLFRFHFHLDLIIAVQLLLTLIIAELTEFSVATSVIMTQTVMLTSVIHKCQGKGQKGSTYTIPKAAVLFRPNTYARATGNSRTGITGNSRESTVPEIPGGNSRKC